MNQATNPLLVRRGGCAIKKKSRSYRSGADGVVAHDASVGMHFCSLSCERPPRPLQIMWLRTIFLDVASTPPHEETSEVVCQHRISQSIHGFSTDSANIADNGDPCLNKDLV